MTRSYLAERLGLLIIVWTLTVPLINIVAAGDRLAVFPNLQVDSATYDRIGLALANRYAIDVIPPFQPPGFVTVLAVIYGVVGHSVITAKVMLWGCLVLATALAARVAYRLHGSVAAGWAAALLTASSQALQAYSGSVQYEVLAALVLLTLVIGALRVWEMPDMAAALRLAAFLGIAAGLAALTREVLVSVVPLLVAFVWIGLARRFGFRAGAGAAVVLAVSCACVIVPWSLVQSRRAHHMVLITDKAGLAWVEGQNPLANGTWNVALAGTGEPAGLAFVRAYPRREVWLVGRKVRYFWGILRDGWNVPQRSAVWLARAAGGLLPLQLILATLRGGWLLAAFVVACARLRKDEWRQWWLLPATVLMIMIAHVVTVASFRFTVPVLPIVFVLISGVIARVAIVVVSKPRLLIPAVALVGGAALMQMSSWPLNYDLEAAEMDGLRAENRTDLNGIVHRFAGSAGGNRPVLILNDEYLPGGRLALQLLVRRGPGRVPPGTALGTSVWRPVEAGSRAMAGSR